MSKIFFWVSLILFFTVCLLPFTGKPKEVLKPLAIQKTNIELTNTFNKTLKRPEYGKEYIIEYKESKVTELSAPTIQAESAIVIDLNSDEIIYSKNAEEKKPVASLVKVMTAITVVEHTNIQDTTTISIESAETGENTMGLKAGEKFTNLELLYGLILNSGNDAAYALAESTSGSPEMFVEYMNKKARLLGAYDTLFVDPSGLNPENKDYYSTAEDMAKIAQYSLEKHPILREIYQTVRKELPFTEEHGLKILENQTNLLTTYPGVKGIKTGYTEEAGLCLITYAENNNEDILLVILNSTDRKGDAILLLDYAFTLKGVGIEHNLLN